MSRLSAAALLPVAAVVLSAILLLSLSKPSRRRLSHSRRLDRFCLFSFLFFSFPLILCLTNLCVLQQQQFTQTSINFLAASISSNFHHQFCLSQVFFISLFLSLSLSLSHIFGCLQLKF
ncbi:unnamed protein product [Prunus brigantina]